MIPISGVEKLIIGWGKPFIGSGKPIAEGRKPILARGNPFCTEEAPFNDKVNQAPKKEPVKFINRFLFRFNVLLPSRF